MREIVAYIRANRLNKVIDNLHEIEGLTGVSVIEIKGYGRMRDSQHTSRIVDNLIDEQHHCKLEIICKQSLVEHVVQSIVKGAHSGLRGDGKIYIRSIDEAIRISTGERGEIAV